MSETLKITPVQTAVFHPKNNLIEFIIKSLGSQKLSEKMILVITSKIVSLAENQLVPKNSIDKTALIQSEADYDLGETAYACRLTIKHGLFIPSAGIDESNSETGDYILFPKDPYSSAKKIHLALCEFYKLESLGVLITDSHTSPLRQGVTGIALSYWGFEGVKNLVGHKDLFGREMVMSQMNLVDGLASAAVLMMGETNEAYPLAFIENAPVKFQNETNPNEVKIPVEQDLYYPFFKDKILIKNKT